MQMNRLFTLGILFIGFIAFSGCKRDPGPVGPQGPAGPAGSDANFAIGEYLVEAADFQSDYAEIQADVITQDVMEDGVVLVYILDDFGYWNHVPSQWTPIVGFSFVWHESVGGRLGLDHDPTLTINDYTVRVVTMFQKAYEEIPADEILQDYEGLVNFLQTR